MRLKRFDFLMMMLAGIFTAYMLLSLFYLFTALGFGSLILEQLLSQRVILALGVKEIAEDIKALHEKLRITIIYVTHDINEAIDLGHRLAVMNQGKLEQCDTPRNLMRNPKTSFVAHFVRSRTR